MTIQSSMVQGSVSSTVNAVHIWPSPDAARQKTYREHLGIHQTDGQLATFSRLLAPSWLSGSKLVAAGQLRLRAVTQRTDRTALRPAEGLASQSTQHDHCSTLPQTEFLKLEPPCSPASRHLSATRASQKASSAEDASIKVDHKRSKPSTWPQLTPLRRIVMDLGKPLGKPTRKSRWSRSFCEHFPPLFRSRTPRISGLICPLIPPRCPI